MDIKFSGAGRGPGQSCGIEERFIFGAAVRLHVSSVGQNHRLSIADGLPTGGRRDRCPDVFHWIVDRALGDPAGVAGSS